jgi:glycosyltransferase involved in cell wall biosynthesis
MRFHVVALPHTHTTVDFNVCAYTNKVRGFCKMMNDLGHKVFLYSGEQNDTPCFKHICCIDETSRANIVGKGHYTEINFDLSLPYWKLFNDNAIREIKSSAWTTDFICVIGGIGHKPIADAFPNMTTVEFGVGYGGSFSLYRVWESQAWRHLCYGSKSNNNPHGVDGFWYDTVIHGYLDPNDFEFSDTKEDYLLFVGRLIERKGFRIAIDIAERANKKLIIAGPGNPPPKLKNVEYVGIVNTKQRSELMSKAIALLVPTVYIEPFGNVCVEAMACGTPAITSDFGAFSETVINGVTGQRCHILREFVAATQQKYDYTAIRKYTIDNFSHNVIGKKYETYFKRLETLRSGGWYSK